MKTDGPDALQRVLDLARKTGRLYVATDVWDALEPHRGDARLAGIRIERSRFLEKGSILAVDEPFLESGGWGGF